MFFKKKEPVYIAITRALALKFPEKITEGEVREYLQKNGVNCSDETLNFALRQLGYTEDGTSRLLNAEYYFSLLDYEELTEARKNSREARWLAVIAILISVASLAFVWLGTSNVRLAEDQANILMHIRDYLDKVEN
jgi:hypothetical protein